MAGHSLLVDCLADPIISAEAESVLSEVSLALIREYGFTADEMREWVKGVLDHTNNPTIGDTVIRTPGAMAFCLSGTNIYRKTNL